MADDQPAHLNIADFFLDARVREGRGDRTALLTDAGRWSYREIQALANRYANVLNSAGVAPEQRVIIALARRARLRRGAVRRPEDRRRR